MQRKPAVYNIAVTALFTAVIAVCSWMSITVGAIPYTLQTFAVFCTAGLLGWKRGVPSVLIYILLGAIGLPVFHGFTGGFGIILGSTGGYIVGFIATAAIVGLVSDRFGRKILPLAVGMAVGMAVCYAFGTAWYMVVYSANGGKAELGAVLMSCVVPFLIADACKIAAAVIIVNRVSKRIKV